MTQYWVVEYTLWPTTERAEESTGRHTARSTYEAESPLDAVNAAMYYTRGRKSDFEVAHIDNIEGPFDEESKAKAVQWNGDGE